MDDSDKEKDDKKDNKMVYQPNVKKIEPVEKVVEPVKSQINLGLETIGKTELAKREALDPVESSDDNELFVE